MEISKTAEFIEEARIVILTLETSINDLKSIEKNIENVTKSFSTFSTSFEKINSEFKLSIDKNINFDDLNKSIHELSTIDTQLKTFKRNHTQLKREVFHSWFAVAVGVGFGFIFGHVASQMHLLTTLLHQLGA